MYVYIHIYICIGICVCIYIRIYIYMYKWIYAYVYMYLQQFSITPVSPPLSLCWLGLGMSQHAAQVALPGLLIELPAGAPVHPLGVRVVGIYQTLAVPRTSGSSWGFRRLSLPPHSSQGCRPSLTTRAPAWKGLSRAKPNVGPEKRHAWSGRFAGGLY